MLSSVVRFILDPFHILLFLAVGVFFAYHYSNKRTFRLFATLAALWFLVITTPFIPYAVLYSLESRYLPLDVDQLQPDQEIHIIVLGAGYVYNKNLPPNSQLDKEMLSRLAEGVRVYHGIQNSTLIVSGPFNHHTYSQADVARKAALHMGVADSLIQTQSEGHTTFEEARIYYQTFYEGHQLVVVTSAAHMHRALGEFRRLGIDAIPSPSSYRFRSEQGMDVSYMPSISNIEALRSGQFEYAALFRNYIRETVKYSYNKKSSKGSKPLGG